MTDEERMAVIIAGDAQIECRNCRWLGHSDDVYIYGSTGSCPRCRSIRLVPYRAEQALP